LTSAQPEGEIRLMPQVTLVKMICRFGLLLRSAVLAIAITFSGCKKSASSSDLSRKSATDITAESLGLPPDFKNIGAEESGRVWFRQQDDEGGANEHWVYDPKDKRLFSAKKDEKSGEWVLKEKLEVTAASLGLPSNAVEMGKDPNGLFWFEIPGAPDRRVYNPATGKLHRAVKNASGQWEIGPLVSTRP
jgi:hypothetical protein